ncbi:MAG: integrase [Acidobacteria bacterium]|nr:integrase [Acidobacteriota bacterium]
MSTDAHRLQTLDQVRDLLEDDRTIPQVQSRADAYRLIERTVAWFDYDRLRKVDKGLIRRYLGLVTGLSRAQITRLLKQHRTTGALTDRRGAPRRPFPRRYTNADEELLAQVDALHGALSARATRKLLGRAYELFGDRRFGRLAGVSKGHLYNLRRAPGYLQRRGAASDPTRPPGLTSRQRWRSQPFPRPGHVRVATVQSVDTDPFGNLYLIELADEVTAFRVVRAVAHLDPSHLIPAIHTLRRAFPFTVVGFHVARDSKPAERLVAALLQTWHTVPATEGLPRPRLDHPGDADRDVDDVNAFLEQTLAPYVNYHRLCSFSSERVDAGGRVRIVHRDADIMTPYERLRSLPAASACLTAGTTLAQLDAVAAAMSDNEAARAVAEARDRLFPPAGPSGAPALAAKPPSGVRKNGDP